MPDRFSIMAKPVCSACNLRCGYCYYADKAAVLYPGQDTRMSLPTLELYTRAYMAAQPIQATFGWQGGEPLLAGREFYRAALDYQRQYRQADQVVQNAVQTNGTLIDDAWAELFAKGEFLVGLSLDGPPAWHDANRRDASGGGSFDHSWRGMETLLRHNVPVNVLVTLNSRNAGAAVDIYRYLVNRGVRWMQFIPILERNSSGAAEEFSCTPERWGRFLVEMFDLWRQRHVGTVSERTIDSTLHAILYGQAAMCCQAQSCANAFVLEWNGDLYVCDHFVYPHWRLGNLHERPLAELLASPLLEEFGRLKTQLPRVCRECEFLPYCHGGCPKHYLPASPQSDPAAAEFDFQDLPDDRVNYFCEGYKIFFRHALPELKRLAATARP